MRSRSQAARHAAILFAVCGLLALTALPTPGSRAVDLLSVAAADLGTAALLLLLPWDRLPQWSTLTIVVPAFGIIAMANSVGLTPPRTVSMMFVLVFVWLGSHHQPWQSLWVAPLAGPAYWGAVSLIQRWPSSRTGLRAFDRSLGSSA